MGLIYALLILVGLFLAGFALVFLWAFITVTWRDATHEEVWDTPDGKYPEVFTGRVPNLVGYRKRTAPKGN